MYNILSIDDIIYLLKVISKYAKIFITFLIIIKIIGLLSLDNQYIYNINQKSNRNDIDYFSSYIENISEINNIFIKVLKISYTYSNEYKLIEIKYSFQLKDIKNNNIKPSDIPLIYNLQVLCDIYILDNEENIYSFANIQENQFYFCVEYIKITENAKFGIKIYKTNEIEEEIDTFEKFFFTDELIKKNLNPIFQNNNRFNMYYINNDYNKILFKIYSSKKKKKVFKKNYNLKFSFIKPPICYLKRDVAQAEGKWYFNNIYGNYFCFCRGENCINLRTFFFYNYQSCKYYFYLTIIDSNRKVYPKTHYLLSDFFSENIEPSDAFPIFQEMIKQNLNAYYLTISQFIYNQFCINNPDCYNNLHIIYGIRKINGDTLEKLLELFLKLKVVITAEQYDTIDNIFYNIEYITYIFLGHGVQYIKSYLYNDYLSYKRYDKMLLPPCQKIIDVALKGGWKIDNIIKIGLPKWDNYEIFKNNKTQSLKEQNEEKSIFLMFTWRKVKKGQNISELYFDNLYNIFNDYEINEQFQNQNVKLYYCYHHKLKDKRRIKTNGNIRQISQNEISTLLKNSSLIITDFSAIMFDAIIQKKPLILYIPDALDINLKDKYILDYYEVITKIKKGMIYLFEIFFNLNDVINKILYYIKNDFVLEKEKLKYYNEFRFKNKGNTKKFIRYIKMLK